MTFTHDQQVNLAATALVGSIFSTIATGLVLVTYHLIRSQHVELPDFLGILYWLFVIMFINSALLLTSGFSHHFPNEVCSWLGVAINAIDLSLYFYLVFLCIEVSVIFVPALQTTTTNNSNKNTPNTRALSNAQKARKKRLQVAAAASRRQLYLSVTFPSAILISGVSVLIYGLDLYAADSEGGTPWCWMTSNQAARIIFCYAFMVLSYVMGVVICLRVLCVIPLAEFTGPHGVHVRRAVTRVFLYPGVFFVIFFCDILNRSYQAFHGGSPFALTYLQTLFYPLQGLVQSVVFVFKNVEVVMVWKQALFGLPLESTGLVAARQSPRLVDDDDKQSHLLDDDYYTDA